MNYIDHPASYEDLINNSKLSFDDKNELEKILMDAVDNQTYDDYKFAIKECYLQLKYIYYNEGWNSRQTQIDIIKSIPAPIHF